MRTMMSALRGFIALLAVIVCVPAMAIDAEPTGKTLRVATRSVPPFAYQDESGRWQGIAIELWERATAELGYKSEYRAVTLPEMLEAVTDGKVDAAVAALTITSDREAKFDFTHPFFRSGLGIAVPAESTSGFDRIVRGLASPTFLSTVGTLFTLLAIVGALIWFLERRHNTQFPADPVRGIGVGLWFSSVTMTTVGYGDKAPLTLAGRSVALIWMLVSVILFSFVTASLTTALTVDALSGKVRSEDDLRHARTGTVAHSTSATRLTKKGYAHHTYPDLKAAMTALAENKLDAVVYDQPLLRYLTKTDFADKVRVLPVMVESQDYGVGLPLGSALRKPINRALLHHGQGAEWDALVARYIGETN